MNATQDVCGCCSGISARTPLEVENRPGLSAVSYRVGVHGDFLASMIAALTDPGRPKLAELGTRDHDDFSIALLDAWAVAADVLCFYNERLAQEAYLRTARLPISLQELVRLIGYRPRPGVAAETYLAFALEPPPEVPEAATRDPGAAPPVTPAVVTLEPGLRVQSIPGPGEQPQVFETVEEIEARPAWNALAASLTTPAAELGLASADLAGVGLNVKPGDGLLLGLPAAPGAPWEFRTVVSVEDDAAHGRTTVTWSGPLPSSAPYLPTAATMITRVFRRRLSVFGHNAPLEERITKDAGEWEFALSGSTKTGNWVDLDGSHPDVVVGSLVVLSRQGEQPRLWNVAESMELSRSDYAVSGKITRVRLTGGSNFSDFTAQVRTTTVFAVDEKLALAGAKRAAIVSDDAVEVEVDASEMRPGRHVIVRGTTTAGHEHAEVAIVDEVQQVTGGWRIVLDEDLSSGYERETVVVHGNVARATHGETVRQILGSGRAREAFQRFTLGHDPLTHVQSSDAETGAEAALDVRVNDVRWKPASTLFAAGSEDRAYVVRTDETGARSVQFGDGARGARLPSGSNNVTARYRKGLGAAGNVDEGKLAQLLDRPLGVKGVANPLAAEGGVDAETVEKTRASAPLTVRTLGRAVSLLDYEDYARAFTGVVKANAVVLALPGGRAVVVTVAFEGGDRLDDLAEAVRSRGDPRVDVVVLAATTATFRLALKVAVDPDHEAETVRSAVEAALREAYSHEARALAEPLFRSEIVATVHSVAGVVALDLDRLYTGTIPGLADRLLAPRAEVVDGSAVPAGVLVLDPAPLDWLLEMP